MYALGQCHHSVAVQNIRTMTIVQLLLGNIGICGGGINALRGEPNVQGSTDHALLSHSARLPQGSQGFVADAGAVHRGHHAPDGEPAVPELDE